MTVLSAATTDAWTLTDMFVQERDGVNCTYDSYHTTDLGLVWADGTFQLFTQARPGDDCCRAQALHAYIDSDVFDLTRYKTARFKATLTMYSERYVEPGGPRVKASINLKSHVPGSDGLPLVDETLYAEFSGETREVHEIDLSLENALALSEASITMEIEVIGGCGGYGTYLWNQVYAEVVDLRIVATK